MTVLKQWQVALGVVLCVAIGVMANSYSGKGDADPQGLSGSQEIRMVERRMSLLEQRLYSIELSISRLEQSASSQRTPLPQPGARDPDRSLLQRDIQALHLRLTEIECGLIKLDERTIAAGVREARSGAKPADPCRSNPAAPLRLSTRP
jgi:hypothetical protein